MLSVSDNGCGMASGEVERCFEPFFTTKKAGEGTGLGLATVYGIVMQNRGFVDVASKKGKGSTFKIYFPCHKSLQKEKNMEYPKDMEYPENRKEADIPGGTETILIVEDEGQVLALGKAVLEKLGYRVLAAETPSKALDTAGEYRERIHLLVTDVIMPEMDGKQLSARIMKIRPDIKCIYMSGYSANIIRRWGMESEKECFIQKPFSVRDIAAMVRNILDKPEQEKR